MLKIILEVILDMILSNLFNKNIRHHVYTNINNYKAPLLIENITEISLFGKEKKIE